MFSVGKPLSKRGVKNRELSAKGVAYMREMEFHHYNQYDAFFESQTLSIEMCRYIDAGLSRGTAISICDDATVKEATRMLRALRLDDERQVVSRTFKATMHASAYDALEEASKLKGVSISQLIEEWSAPILYAVKVEVTSKEEVEILEESKSQSATNTPTDINESQRIK